MSIGIYSLNFALASDYALLLLLLFAKGLRDCVMVVERFPALHYSVEFIFLTLMITDSINH